MRPPCATCPDGADCLHGWTAHHIAAHLAAGSREIADLAEDLPLAARPDQPGPSKSEAPYPAMPYSDVLKEMIFQTRRKLAAYEAIAAVCDEPGIDFTGNHHHRRRVDHPFAQRSGAASLGLGRRRRRR